ncbi:hypothetical protein WJX84_001883 [Apatococcus fuscideae]|uniref:Uncharacterized protein n=1 Tax=Apatococcus fuscideae TaxID=2026836 RepID=A0AAW1TK09_9CHLO
MWGHNRPFLGHGYAYPVYPPVFPFPIGDHPMSPEEFARQQEIARQQEQLRRRSSGLEDEPEKRRTDSEAYSSGQKLARSQPQGRSSSRSHPSTPARSSKPVASPGEHETGQAAPQEQPVPSPLSELSLAAEAVSHPSAQAPSTLALQLVMPLQAAVTREPQDESLPAVCKVDASVAMTPGAAAPQSEPASHKARSMVHLDEQSPFLDLQPASRGTGSSSPDQDVRARLPQLEQSAVQTPAEPSPANSQANVEAVADQGQRLGLQPSSGLLGEALPARSVLEVFGLANEERLSEQPAKKARLICSSAAKRPIFKYDIGAVGGSYGAYHAGCKSLSAWSNGVRPSTSWFV